MNIFYMLIALTAGLWLIKPAPPINWDEVPLEEKVNSLEYWDYLEKSIDQENAANEQAHITILEPPKALPPIIVEVKS